jgi:S1-C subfamily serine protease
VIVASVTPGSSGADAGIRPGDAILEVNRRPVTDVETFRAAMTALKPGESVPIQLRRGSGNRSEYVVLRAPAR